MYRNFSTQDFLLDEYFISSKMQPTLESIAFWKEYADSKPKNISEFYLAQLELDELASQKENLSDLEMESLWSSIDKKTRTRRKIIYYLLPTACVAAVFFAFIGISMWNDNIESDLYQYASKTTPIDSVVSRTQLILAEDKTIILNDTKSNISYDSLRVTAGEEEVDLSKLSKYNTVITSNGSISEVTLSDGTRLIINARSKVVYPTEFESNKREIYVEGEVYLDVARNTESPFWVRTKEMSVKVLGTKFSVFAREGSDTRRVVLESGSVAVKDYNKETLLKPNYMYQSKNGRSVIEHVNVDEYLAWIERMYIANAQPLHKIISHLNEYYGVNILYDNEASDVLCSGKLDMKEDLEKLLKGLTNTLPITYTKEGEIHKIAYKK